MYVYCRCCWVEWGAAERFEGKGREPKCTHKFLLLRLPFYFQPTPPPLSTHVGRAGDCFLGESKHTGHGYSVAF